MTRRLLTAVLAVVLVAGHVGGTFGHEAAQARDRSSSASWEELIEATATAARDAAYRGEAVWASWEHATQTVRFFEIAQQAGMVDIRMRPVADDVPATGGSVAGSPWAASGESDATGFAAVRVPEPTELERKYEVEITSQTDMLDRRCAMVVITERASGELRERLWVDVDSGLLLRRESYEGAQLLRLVAFLSLHDVDVPRHSRPEPGVRTVAADDPGVVAVQDRGVTALRAAGWTIPDELPGGYELEEVHAHGGGGAPPLHLVYSDGLYGLSLFAQRGAPEIDDLPAGARRAQEVQFEAYEWPGASPRRLVWAGGDTTFTLIGDLPPSEFHAIAESLPASRASWVDRLRNSAARWWSSFRN